MAFHMYPSTYTLYFWHLQAQNAVIWSLPRTIERDNLRLVRGEQMVWAEDSQGKVVYWISGAIGLRGMSLWEAEQFRLALSSEAKRNAAWTGSAASVLGILFPGAREMLLVRAVWFGAIGAGAGFTYTGLRADTMAVCISEAKNRYRNREHEAAVMIAWKGVIDVTCIPEQIERDLTWTEIKQLEVKDRPWW